MPIDDERFLHTTLGRTGIKVFRMGLSATYRPGRRAVHRALDEGVDFFFCYGFDTQTTGVLREVFKTRRSKLVVATGAYNFIWGHPNLRRTLEKRLRQLETDYIDLFLFLGVLKPEHFPDGVAEELVRFREEGKVRAVGVSTHNRTFAGLLATTGELDVLMIRYNAAHRGAETEVFPSLKEHEPGVISYTATRWRYLLRRPRGWSRKLPVPTAGMCYRFVLSNPNVHICLTAPTNIRQLEQNLEAARQGPLNEEELRFMREFGDAVHRRGKWFM